MNKTTLFGLLGLALALSVRAQDLTTANAGAKSIIDQFKAEAAQHLKTMQLPPAGPGVSYALDPVTSVDASAGKTIKMKSYVSNCPDVELPFAVDARAMTTGRAMPGGKALVVAGVLETWDKSHGACGGVAMPADFEVANPVPNSLPQVEIAGAGSYQLAEVTNAALLPTMSPVPQMGITVNVRAGEQLAGAFLIDATKQNGGTPTVIVGAIIFSPPPQPGVMVPQHVQAVHLVARSPVSGQNLQIKLASR